MEHTYTRLVQSKIDEINNKSLSSDFDYDLSDNTEELKKLANEFNRPFSEGLTQLLKYTSYDGDLDNIEEKRAFIRKKLKSIGASADEKTVLNWLDGSSYPRANEAKDTTRDRIYRLCFALSASMDDVDWFFNHVYFQRSFYCRRMEEAVYYYCFKNNYDYGHARQLISDIQAFSEPESANSGESTHTREIQNQLDHCSTDEELKQYFRKNKWMFQEEHLNQSAEKALCELLDEIQGKETDRAIAEGVRESYNPDNESRKIKYNENSPEIANCGLIVQEVFPDKPYYNIDGTENDSLLNCLLKDNDPSSISTMLKCIYGTIGHEENMKEINLPEKRRENFPSEKIFSDLQDGKIRTSKNYDAIRKCLILLLFYSFWCRYKLDPSKFPDGSSLYETYLSQTNDCLEGCGFDNLYPGNNYDRLFILCSGSAAPLEAFRKFLE